jgi:hypothetical protein
MDDSERVLRELLLQRLLGRGAHMPFEDAVKDFPAGAINTVFPNGTYTPWALVEHMRRTQADILEYVRDPNYKHKDWPKDYWPEKGLKVTPEQWDETLAAFFSDRAELEAMVQDPAVDLYAKIPWGGDHTLLREVLIVSDHNAYHTGEFAIMRQTMDTWGDRSA